MNVQAKKLIFRSIVLTKVDTLEHPFRGTKSFGIIKTQEVFAIPSMMFIGSDISRAVALSREN